MKTKIFISIEMITCLLAWVASSSVQAQMNFGLDLNVYPKVYNPVPMRDSIPAAIAQGQNSQPRFSNSILVFYPSAPVVTHTTSVANATGTIEKKFEFRSNVGSLDTLVKPSNFNLTVTTSLKLLVFSPTKVAKVRTQKIVFDPKTQPTPPLLVALPPIAAPNLGEDTVQVTPINEISNDEYKMIQALLLLEYQKKQDTAMALLIDLINNSKLKTQALYHYAQIALNYNLKTEYKSKMLHVMRSNDEPVMPKKAIENLIANAHAIEPEDTVAIDNEIARLGLKPSYSDSYLIKKGKYLVTKGELNQAEVLLNQIGQNSKVLVEARLLLSNINYRTGDVNGAIKNLEGIIAKLSSDRSDKLRNLTFLTLGRLHFQKGDYKKSYAQYLLIDKSNNLWLQSSTEQALTQIMAGDYVGAAGNMFSLHTEYFKKAYAPESYIIRSVGYLNLCQFGDSVSVIAELQKRYEKANQQIQAFLSSGKTSAEYYALVRELFSKADGGVEINGLPKAFIIELARHPSYISTQKKINSFEEELAQFTQVANGLANKTASIRASIAAAKLEIGNVKQKEVNGFLIEQIQRKILSLEAELSLSISGREKIEKAKSLAAERISAEKSKLKVVAGEKLQKRFAQAAKELSETLEQKDLLAYEIYSGAGEHLRYQMAGGESKERNPASELTPEEKQSYKWKFKGEVWEDEIGHYRSSLTNVCAKEDFAKNTGGN